MADNFEIVWTDLALEELEETVNYLEEEFTNKEIEKLGDEIERILSLIKSNPKIFPLSKRTKTRKAVVLRYNSMYYRILMNEIQIISFFSNRQDPKKRKF